MPEREERTKKREPISRRSTRNKLLEFTNLSYGTGQRRLKEHKRVRLNHIGTGWLQAVGVAEIVLNVLENDNIV